MKYLKYIIAFFIIIIPSIVMVLIYNDKISQDSPEYYKRGVELYNEGNYSLAYANFVKIKRISPLYPAALYKQAKSAQKAGDYNTAVLKYKLFLQKSSSSLFKESAEFNLAKCYFYLKDYDSAKLQFLGIKNENKNIGAEDYYLGIIEKKSDKNKSAQYFINYIKDDKDSNKPNELSAAEELSSFVDLLTNDDIELIGKVFYKHQKYKQALEYFSKLPISKNWDYLVLSNHYAGNKVIAKKLIESGLKDYSYTIDEDNLYKIYDIYTSYMRGTRLKNWQQMLKIVQNGKFKGEDYILYKIAELSVYEKALAIYSTIQSEYPDSKYASEALWNVFWSLYNKKDYVNAEVLANKHLNNYKDVKSTPKMLFWLAKCQLKLKKNSEAYSNLSKLVSKYGDDYYGLRAEAIINKKNDFWTTDTKNKIPDKNEEIDFPITLSDMEIKDIKLINNLFSLGDYEIWLDAKFGNNIVESWFEKRKDKKSRSIVLARDAIKNMEVKPPYISSAYKLAYPKYWVNEINIAGEKLGLDPYLIIALIREESYFNPDAVSSSNAVGLMQLMPSTANYMLSQLSVNYTAIENLKNPRTNMYIGCNYLKYLKDRFNNDLYVVAAYNGGEGSVNKWIKKYDTSDSDEFIENIPFDETRNYVKKVFRTYHIYKKIYE